MKTRIHRLSATVAAYAAVLLLASGCACHKNGSCCAKPEPTPAPAAKTAAPAKATPAPTAALANTAANAKPTLKVVKVDSQETEGEDGRAANAVDGDVNTFWHTQWQDANPPCPHEIILELVPPAAIKGLTYLPRQDGGVNGTIKDYELYGGDNAEHIDTPLAHGSFGEGAELKTVSFGPKTCRYLKLKALSEQNGEAWTSAAEIGVVTQ
jgi:hypothetical protein